MQTIYSLLMLIGRIGFFIIFFLSGLGKFQHPEAVAVEMAAKGMSMIPFFLYAAAVIEIVGGIALLIGYQTRFAALAMFLYLIPVTVIMHDFWNASELLLRYAALVNFLKNIAIMGGLLYVVAAGAGRLSADALQKRA